MVKAFSYYVSEKVYKLLKGNNKELITIHSASQFNLYDSKQKYYRLMN